MDHQQMIWLQQLCSRCLHRNAPETVVVMLHRRKVVDVEAVVTCELTSVQARQGSHGFAGNLFGLCPPCGEISGGAVRCLWMYA